MKVSHYWYSFQSSLSVAKYCYGGQTLTEGQNYNIAIGRNLVGAQTHLKSINKSFLVVKVEEGGKVHEKVQGGHNGGRGVVAMSLEAQGHSRGQFHHTAALAPIATLRLVHYLAQQLIQQ